MGVIKFINSLQKLLILLLSLQGMLPQLNILIAQNIHTAEYLDLDTCQNLPRELAFKKRFICNIPRFVSDNIELFYKITRVCKDTSNVTNEITSPSKQISLSSLIPTTSQSIPSRQSNLFIQNQPLLLSTTQSMLGTFNGQSSELKLQPLKFQAAPVPQQIQLLTQNQQSLLSQGLPVYKTLSARPILNIADPSLLPSSLPSSLPSTMQTNIIDAKSIKNLQKCLDNLHERGGPGCRYLNLDTGMTNALNTIKTNKSLIYRDDTLLIASSNKEIFEFFQMIIRDYGIETPIVEGQPDEIKIDKKLRVRVWIENNGMSMISQCWCCNNELKFTENYEAGHIIARAKGGPTDINNLKPVCRSCNRSMGVTHMKEYALSKGFLGRIIK